jgi:hypothetical protein
MRGVSKRIIKVAAVASMVAAIVVQPALAAAKAPTRASDFGSLIRTIIRVLDAIDIGLPPG